MCEAFGERLKKVGVTRVQWIALYYLNRFGDMKQKELGEKMHVKESSIARLIDRMERDELIDRVKSKEDRRITNIRLTEKGAKYIQKLLPEGEKFNNIVSKDISEEDMDIFKKVLNKMVDNINSMNND
ncbi:MarR family winged helix-turn-helix transcriptional regulator [Clostridiisalibacter paucivorans]|uniref:MarR family winged helix-turn-helix transcriptional regulator n=1 Tax=Clostridiisalibacter paucivorans TaxID=408753 RepID=UPI0006847C32|nr:MarR family transcriptional regulator [Clostridiisalibacter paucivorans]